MRDSEIKNKVKGERVNPLESERMAIMEAGMT
jgi:hypothetical protein